MGPIITNWTNQILFIKSLNCKYAKSHLTDRKENIEDLREKDVAMCNKKLKAHTEQVLFA